VISPTGVVATRIRRFGDPVTGTLVGTGDHWLDVPLDRADPARGTITVYAREVRAEPADGAPDPLELPYLVFLQGGPGGRSPRPGAQSPPWLVWAVQRYRVLLVDQRGTGRSTPLDRHTLADDAWSVPGSALSDEFLASVADVVSFARHPLYPLIHEACLADGEMVFPGDLRDDPALAPVADAGELVAHRADAEPLYDPARLAGNTVPVVAWVYTQDMYVVPELSLPTAAVTGAVTVIEDHEHHHDGLRRAGPEILDRMVLALPEALRPVAPDAGVAP
jgi:hypothetical protein